MNDDLCDRNRRQLGYDGDHDNNRQRPVAGTRRR